MMRPYRGKRLDGEWVYGWYAENPNGEPVIYSPDNPAFPRRVDPATVGQSTGLKDCKRTAEYPDGQEIYKDDKVIPSKPYPHVYTVGVVVWDKTEARFKVQGTGYYDRMTPRFAWNDLEVVGSVHDKEVQ